MADDRDESQQTEEPTHRRLEQAHKQGDVVQSSEVTTFVVLAAGALSLALFGQSGAENFARHFTIFLQEPDRFDIEPGSMIALMQNVGLSAGLIIAPVVGLLMVLAVGSHLVQHRFVFTTDRLKLDFSKLNPMSGLKRLFGFDGATNLLKGLIKVAIIGSVTWTVLWPERGHLDALLGQSPLAITSIMMALLMKVLIAALSVLAVIAGGDYLLQRYRFTKRHRMSKQEIKEEYRQAEGDPAVKAKIRQVRLERSKRRMMAKVPEATVVIMNPTHFAVALQYESGKMAAPVCVAKGMDALALRIRAVAEEHDVPIIENPPLARALYAAVEVDEPVPAEHYKAVAQVVGYVMRLTGKLKAN
ncbi:MAG TPA: flagellar biosynthesis protein FlhB [Rhizomicrobium sp.]|jgi:flagellar biosynthetic protein FlhB